MDTQQSCDRVGRESATRRLTDRKAATPAGLKAARLLFGLSIIISLLPLGAVDWVAFDFSNSLVAGSCLAALAFSGNDRRLLPLEIAAAMTALAFMLWVLLQVTAFPGILPAHPLWRAASDILGQLEPTASLDPGAGFYALPSVLSPFLTFVACLRLFGDDRSAWQLINALGAGAGLITLYGVAQFLLFPDSGLIYADLVRGGSFTGVLINRNNTATLLGVTALLLFASIFREVQRQHPMRATNAFEPVRFAMRHPTVPAYLFLLLVALTALLLTSSRAGIGSTIIGFLLMVVLLGVSPVSPSKEHPAVVRRLVYVAAGVASVLLVSAVFSGSVWMRVEAGALDDARFCILTGLLNAVRDNGTIGAGFNTFQQVFQAYRDPACGLGFVWDRAHDFYLEGAITLGVPFVVGCLVVFSRLFVTWWRGLRLRRGSRAAPAAGAAVMVLVAIHSLVDFSLQIPGIAIFVSAALGGCAIVSEIRGSSPNGTISP